MERLRQRARRLKIEAVALGLAARHPQTPWYAKVVVAAVLVYVVTPVDFAPDFLPVLGFIDDLVFVPAAFAVAVRFIPAPVLHACRGRAAELAARPRKGFRAWLARVIKR
jgi:uncharacterized membrane protein YkvA (DUF1232 family)